MGSRRPKRSDQRLRGGEIFKAGACAPLLLCDKENMKFTNVHDANQSRRASIATDAN